MSPLAIFHIACGFTALTSGLIPMVSRKGSLLHRRGGWVFVAGMAGVFVSAIPLSWLSHNWFLFCIAIFSGYLTFSGFRMPARKQGQHWPDSLVAGLTALVSLGMIGYAVWLLSQGQMGTSIVLAVFGSISLLFSGRDSYEAWRGVPPDQHAWLFGHIVRMGGAYIASFTAFAVTTLDQTPWPGIINWLLPTVVGSILISRNVRHWRKQMTQA
jgi:hypothetical protein